MISSLNHHHQFAGHSQMATVAGAGLGPAHHHHAHLHNHHLMGHHQQQLDHQGVLMSPDGLLAPAQQQQQLVDARGQTDPSRDINNNNVHLDQQPVQQAPQPAAAAAPPPMPPLNGPKPRGRRRKIRTEPIRPICPQCEKQFSNQSALTKHKLTHSDERKFACHQCSKAFKRHDHLTGHMQTHSNRKPFNCTIQGCDKTYCDARSLRRHKENIHHISPQSANSSNVTPLHSAGPLHSAAEPPSSWPSSDSHLNQSTYHMYTPAPHQTNSDMHLHNHQAPYSADYAYAQQHQQHFSFDFEHLNSQCVQQHQQQQQQQTHSDSNTNTLMLQPNESTNLNDSNVIQKTPKLEEPNQEQHQLQPVNQQQLVSQSSIGEAQQASGLPALHGNYSTPTDLHPLTPQFGSTTNEQQSSLTTAPLTYQQQTQLIESTNETQHIQQQTQVQGQPSASSLYQRRIQRLHSDSGVYTNLRPIDMNNNIPAGGTTTLQPLQSAGPIMGYSISSANQHENSGNNEKANNGAGLSGLSQSWPSNDLHGHQQHHQPQHVHSHHQLHDQHHANQQQQQHNQQHLHNSHHPHNHHLYTHSHHPHQSHHHHHHQAPYSADYAYAQQHHQHFSFDFEHLAPPPPPATQQQQPLPSHEQQLHSGGSGNTTMIIQPANSSTPTTTPTATTISLTDLNGLTKQEQQLHQQQPQSQLITQSTSSSSSTASGNQNSDSASASAVAASTPTQLGGYLTPTTLHPPTPQFDSNETQQQLVTFEQSVESLETSGGQTSNEIQEEEQHHHHHHNHHQQQSTSVSTTSSSSSSGSTTGTTLYQRRLQRHQSDGDTTAYSLQEQEQQQQQQPLHHPQQHNHSHHGLQQQQHLQKTSKCCQFYSTGELYEW